MLFNQHAPVLHETVASQSSAVSSTADRHQDLSQAQGLPQQAANRSQAPPQQSDSQQTVLAAMNGAITLPPAPSNLAVVSQMARVVMPGQVAAGGSATLPETGKATIKSAKGLATPSVFGAQPWTGPSATPRMQPASPASTQVTSSGNVTASAKHDDHSTSAPRDVHKPETASVGSASPATVPLTGSVEAAPSGPANSQNAGADASPMAEALATAATSQTVPSPTLQADRGTAQSSVSASAEATGTGAAAVTEAHALPAINTARVFQSVQGSEMRVGMHSSEFGNVSVSTSLTHESLAAQISFEHLDLGKALTAHLPAIEARLSSEYGMHAKVEVRDQSMQAAAESRQDESGRRGSGSNTSNPHSGSSSLVGGERDGAATGGSRSGTSNEGARLDVQA